MNAEACNLNERGKV